jgi:aminoglycoside-2''-adenylyltransferase
VSVESSHHPRDALQLFGDVVAPWWIAGGWGLDLWLGYQTRPHEDLDVAILRSDQRRFWERLRSWDLSLAVGSGVLEPWTSSIVPEPLHAVWCRPTPASVWAFEILLNDSQGDEWLFRRDHEVRRPLAELGGRTQESVPFLAPEVILL